MRFDVISVFPGVFQPVFSVGVVGRALERGLVSLHAHDLRDFTSDRHRQIDDVPYGGGPGMVMKPEPLFRAIDAVRAENLGPVVLLEPWGRPLNQALVRELATETGLVLVCGRYEGIDDRVREAKADLELSIGDYVLSGGEIAAMVVIDAVARLLPGVVGDPGSLASDSFAADALGYPQYTRPPEFGGLRVPEVLLSGNHQQIEAWRREQAAKRTGARGAAAQGLKKR